MYMYVHVILCVKRLSYMYMYMHVHTYIVHVHVCNMPSPLSQCSARHITTKMASYSAELLRLAHIQLQQLQNWMLIRD